MGQLRDRMEQDLKLKRLSPATIRNYLLYCRKFAAFYMRSPEELGASEIRAFLLHLIEVEQLSYASYRQVYAALRSCVRAGSWCTACCRGIRTSGSFGGWCPCSIADALDLEVGIRMSRSPITPRATLQKESEH